MMHHGKGKFLGLLLILIGVLWLLQRADVLTGTFWQYFWPIVVILIGLKMILWGGHRGDWHEGGWKGTGTPPSQTPPQG